MLKYLICIFICIFVILVKLSILSYLQDTRGCIFYLVSKILFESIFPNPVFQNVKESMRTVVIAVVTSKAVYKYQS